MKIDVLVLSEHVTHMVILVSNLYSPIYNPNIKVTNIRDLFSRREGKILPYRILYHLLSPKIGAVAETLFTYLGKF